MFDENDLPDPVTKMQLYQMGTRMFTENGYTDIGMDHFALQDDELFLAWEHGKLHRNFMGYTTQHTSMLLGLGVSSISDIGVAFAQNKKTIHDYYESIQNNELPVFKGYFLSEEDTRFRHYILAISCKGKTSFRKEDIEILREYTFPQLQQLAADGLIEWDEEGLIVTTTGRQFIRNICSAFDLYMQRNKQQSGKQLYSKAI